MDKVFFAFFFLFISHSIFGQVRVELTNGQELENCTIDSTKTYINCSQAIIKLGTYTPFSLSKEDKTIKTLSLYSIEDKQGNTLYQASPEAINFNTAFTNSKRDEISLYNYLADLNFNIQNILSTSPDAIPQEFKQQLQTYQQDIKNKLQNSKEIISSDYYTTSNPRANCKKIKKNCSLYECQSNESQQKSYLIIPPIDKAGQVNIALEYSLLTANAQGFYDISKPQKIFGNNADLIRRNDSHPVNNFSILGSFQENSSDETDIMSDAYFYQMHNIKGLIEQCQLSKQHDGQKIINQYFDLLKQQKLYQVVTLVNGIFDSVLLDSELISYRNDLCFNDGTYYNQKAYQATRALSPQADNIITHDELSELFNIAKNMELPWAYKQDGCYARAHLMAAKFKELGHDFDKAWINGDLSIQDDQQQIRWRYHVAPAIYAYNEQGEVKRYVIDPSMADQPLTAQQWAQRMTRSSQSEINERSFPFPKNSQRYARASLAYSDAEVYYPDASASKATQEQKLKMAKDILNMFQGYLDEMD